MRRGARRVDKLASICELARWLARRSGVKADLALGAFRRARAAVLSRGTSRLSRRSGRGHVGPGVGELARRLPRRGLEHPEGTVFADLGARSGRVRPGGTRALLRRALVADVRAGVREQAARLAGDARVGPLVAVDAVGRAAERVGARRTLLLAVEGRRAELVVLRAALGDHFEARGRLDSRSLENAARCSIERVLQRAVVDIELEIVFEIGLHERHGVADVLRRRGGVVRE